MASAAKTARGMIPGARWLVALCVLLALISGANCSVNPIPVVETYGSEFITDLSGFEGDFETRVEGAVLGRRAFLLEGVRYKEVGNRPCRVSAWYGGTLVEETFDGCPSSGGANLSSELVRFEDPFVFVRSIRVCANDRNHRLKGIEIWGGRVLATGVAPEDAQYDWHFRANCDHKGKKTEQRQRRDCPGNMVASGLVLAGERKVPNDVDEWSDIKDTITGIRLICIPARVIFLDGG